MSKNAICPDPNVTAICIIVLLLTNMGEKVDWRTWSIPLYLVGTVIRSSPIAIAPIVNTPASFMVACLQNDEHNRLRNMIANVTGFGGLDSHPEVVMTIAMSLGNFRINAWWSRYKHVASVLTT
jgi:hypothetical protein